MTGDKKSDGETLVLSTKDAVPLAEKYDARAGVDKSVPDPFPDIPPSLLSAEHIDKYVRETGLISPYFEGGGKDSRLKKAAYEGKIGNHAYRYDENNSLRIAINRGELTVPANSIVFVECDLEFRLPENIGLRFNLQIRHVHRGLLLGTGPLVDPGYWGKLCIPLHNLTNKDYIIPLDEGLIWIEFTKTTSDINTKEPLGRPPLNKEFWHIKDFIEKSATLFSDSSVQVPIRSSIPDMAIKATESAEAAAEKAKEASGESKNALTSAKNAELSAKNSENAAKDTQKQFNKIGLLGALGVLLALFSLWAAFYFGTIQQISSSSVRIDQTQNTTTAIEKELKTISQNNEITHTDVSKAISEIESLRNRLNSLEKINNNLQSNIIELQNKLDSKTVNIKTDSTGQ